MFCEKHFEGGKMKKQKLYKWQFSILLARSRPCWGTWIHGRPTCRSRFRCCRSSLWRLHGSSRHDQLASCIHRSSSPSCRRRVRDGRRCSGGSTGWVLQPRRCASCIPRRGWLRPWIRQRIPCERGSSLRGSWGCIRLRPGEIKNKIY